MRTGWSKMTQDRSFRVLLTDRAWPDFDIERAILEDAGASVVEAPDQDEATLLELARDVDAIGTCWAPVTASIIRAAERCQVIGRFGIGLDNIDVDEATRCGIVVTNVPDYCVSEVAHHALALIMACARKVAFFHHRSKQGDYQLQAGGRLRRLSGQVLGIVGLGQIARQLIPAARAIGFEVIAFTKSGNDHGMGCRMVSFDQLLAESDFISLHLPLTVESRHMFGASEFDRMKPDANLINTSRGGLIDHTELWNALRDNKIAGAALDVFDPEPPDLTQPLFRDDRLIVTPHAAFASEESIVELRSRTATQIADVLMGRQPENVVNRQID